VAAGEYIGPWGRLQSFLAVEELTDMWSLNEAIPAAAAVLPQREFAYWKRTLLAELARLTRSLHDRRWFHKDLYLCHFFVRKEDTRTVPPWPGRVHLIDLHRLAHHPWMWRIWQVKDLAQLLYSSEIPGVTFRDRLQFWRFYLGAGHRHLGSQLLRSFIVFKWRRYQHHNIKRPLSDEW
jgi:heptose I phosphotransferase